MASPLFWMPAIGRFHCRYFGRRGSHPAMHCVKSVGIRNIFGLYSVQMRESTEQKNPEYGHFSRTGFYLF